MLNLLAKHHDWVKDLGDDFPKAHSLRDIYCTTLARIYRNLSKGN